MKKTGRHRNEWEPDPALGTGTGSRDLSRRQDVSNCPLRTVQAAMEVAQRYCSTELESYAQCVAANPSTWGVKCHDLKAQVSKCTSSHPVVRKIQAACASEFGAFETCLKENASAVLRCSSHMKGFLACAERVDTGLPIAGMAQKGAAARGRSRAAVCLWAKTCCYLAGKRAQPLCHRSATCGRRTAGHR
ncbi:unnamed protein product [Lampetra fluviatilis]